jgi:murein DD-endopeptidase MepM/ murein hydrolase activator NlpD
MTLAAAVLALLALPAAPALGVSTGGAGLSAPLPVHGAAKTAPAAIAPPILAPLSGIPQLSAGISLRRVTRRAASAVLIGYTSSASSPQQVRTDVVRRLDGLSVFTDVRTVAPGVRQTIRWNGRAPQGVALDGRYQVRISLGGGSGLASSSASGATGVGGSPASGSAGTDATPGGAAAGAPAGGAAPQAFPPPPGSSLVGAFTFVGAVFPVRGRHGYGDAANAFGAGRAGHSHQGQDVLAQCGTPLVAAVGGVVRTRAVQSLAGNYVVIDDPITKRSYVYAHLRTPAIVRAGQRVSAGDPIGVVGETGDATTCHLHFELWTAPGWYAGGQPIDPLATLKGWDHGS